VFYTVRSERLLMEQLDYNLLFCWFVGLGVDEPVWVPTVVAHNRERFLEAGFVHKVSAEVLAQARAADLTSDEPFSVDGTLIEAQASMKRFHPEDEPPSKGGPGAQPQHQFPRRLADQRPPRKHDRPRLPAL